MKTLLKVNFQAALYSLQVYQTGTFPLHFFFLEFFRVTVLLSKCFEKFLKDYITKRLHQRLGKHLKIRRLHILYRRKGLKKIEKTQGRCSCRNPASITYDFKYHMTSSKPDSTTDVVRDMFRIFFRNSYFPKQLLYIQLLYLFGKPNYNCCGRAVHGLLNTKNGSSEN